MKKLLHLAQANIRGHKSSTLSLFIIIVIVSTLMTVGLSILFGINQDFASIVDRSNSLHSAFVMTKDTYSETFEEVIRDDPRVSQYEIVEVLSPESITLDYGGQTDVRAILFDLDTTYEISPPVITASDSSIPPQRAIYLPEYATGLGYRIGDELTLTYKNKPIALTVAGFFATNEFSTVNMASALKFLVPHESYELLAEQFNRSVWIAIRMNDMDDSPQFNQDFASQIDVDLSSIGLVFDSDMYASVTSLVSLLAVIIVVFSLLIVLISILVIRFRIMSSIEDALHEIGVLKSAGYKNAQIVGSYVMEYFIVSLPAALLGVLFALPLFPLVRDAMSSMSGFSWTIGIHPMASMAAVILLVALILMMVLLTCRTIMKLLPVDALRGGASAQKSYRHLFPLGRGAGGLQTKLGLKSIAVFLKTYVMTGLVIAMMTISIIIVFVLYLNLVLDQNTFIKMAGVEAGDVEVYVTRHSDADGLSAQIEEFAGVRKTTMLDWISVEVDGNEAMGNISNDFAQMENMATHTGTLPTNDREVALPKLFADQLGKSIGDTVSVRAAGVSQDYTITGFFSVMSNGGRVLAITLDGYQRLDPNYRRASINVYLDDETTFDDFSQALTSRFGVLNVYDQSDGGSFAQAKMVAEEKISNYIEQYDIDSVAYAVISHGDIVAHGSSSQYQIESIVDAREITKSQLGAFAGTVSLVTQLIVVLALLILSLILTMTVKSIITKRYKELGTLKALGFTTAQLVRQQIISLLPTAVIGVAIGCFIGSLVASPLLTTLLASTGAYGTLFSVPPILAVSVGAVMLVASLGVAFLSARRIKNISAYELISQRPVAKKKQRAHPKGIAQKRTLALRSLAMLMVCVFCFTIVSDALYAQEASSATDSSAPQMIEEDLYGIGSISKVYTAAAVMKLVEEGHIDLDEPLTTYLPQFEMADELYTQITPRMLLNHSSGLKGMTDNNAFLLGDNDTYLHDHFLDLLKTQMLKHAPGERSIYCNDGLTLAEILIEAVSGVSYSQYLEATFLAPLGLKQTKTSQGEFDRDLLANTYRGNNELLAETIGVIGTGGIYATPSDLCRFATIFMESADGSVLSKGSTDEMARDQHQDPMVPQDADTIFRYGLGWDAIETYPFTHYGIKALSKGGDTERYHSNLIVLPDYDLAVAVLSSGKDSHGQLIAQEILLAALREEGVIVDETPPSLPESNLDRARIPDEIKAYAGVYDAGFMGILEVEFTEDSLLLTPLMVKNERTVEYLYNTEGEFVSTKGDFIGLSAPKDGAKGITKLSFADQKYLIVNSAIAMPGLSTTAIAVPLAEKLETNTVASDDFEAWKERNEKEYLLVSEKYTSLYYATEPLAKTLVDDRVVGYVGQGIYRGSGKLIKSAKIVDASYASAFQSIPTMLGRDTNDLRITEQQGVEYLAVNEFKYIDASSLRRLSEFNDQLTLGLETLWVDIDEGLGGSELGIVAPQNGSWFVFDDRMNCIATSLEKNPRHSIVLPDRGRIAFAGEEGATFLLGNQ